MRVVKRSPASAGNARERGRFETDRATVQLGRAQIANSNIFLLSKRAQIHKLSNQPFLSSKILQTLYECILKYKGQLSFFPNLKFLLYFEL
jgi:hypothetical protein